MEDRDPGPRPGGPAGAVVGGEPATGVRWRISVDADRCIGSGLCAATAPGHYRVVGGVSQPPAGPVEPDDAALDAADCCPVEAITVRDATSADVLAPRP